MNRTHTFIASIGLLTLSLLACDRTVDTSDDSATTTGVDDLRELALQSLRDADEAWDRSTINMDSFVSFFADEALWLWVTGQRAIGREEIRSTAERYWSRPGWVLDWEPTWVAVNGTNDIGYTAGDWETIHHDADGQVIEGAGSYFAVWKRDESGAWKVEMEWEFPGDPGMFPEQVAVAY